MQQESGRAGVFPPPSPQPNHLTYKDRIMRGVKAKILRGRARAQATAERQLVPKGKPTKYVLILPKGWIRERYDRVRMSGGAWWEQAKKQVIITTLYTMVNHPGSERAIYQNMKKLG